MGVPSNLSKKYSVRNQMLKKPESESMMNKLKEAYEPVSQFQEHNKVTIVHTSKDDTIGQGRRLNEIVSDINKFIKAVEFF